VRVVDCQAALVVDGAEVFRLRDRDRDGKLIVDFDIREPGGQRIAEVSKNYVANAGPAHEYRNRTGMAEIVERATGRRVVRVQELGLRHVRVLGTLWIGNLRVDIGESAIVVGDSSMSDIVMRGGGTAVTIGRSGIGSPSTSSSAG